MTTETVQSTSRRPLATLRERRPRWIGDPQAVIGCLLMLSVAVFTPRVLGAGLYQDDWPIVSIAQHDGAWSLYHNLIGANHLRPIGAAWQTLTVGVAGADPKVQALFAISAHVLAALAALFVLMRAGLSTMHAAMVCALFLVMPYGDAVWLWPAASVGSVSVALAGGAALCGRRAVAGDGKQGAWHVAATAGWAASVLTYQAAAAAAGLTLLLYLTATTRRRRALTRWALDVVSVGLAGVAPLVITGSAGSTAASSVPIGEWPHHAKVMVDEGLQLLTVVLVPFGGPRRDVLAAALTGLFVLAALQAWRGSAENRGHARRWLGWAGTAAALVSAAYVVYVPALVDYYHPLGRAGDNRVNVFASFGFALFAFAVAMLIGGLVRAVAGSRVAAGVASVLVVVIGAGYVNRTSADVDVWNLSAVRQQQELGRFAAAGHPPQRSSSFVFGGLGEVGQGVSVFRVTWDFGGAVQARFNDLTLQTYPIFAGTTMRCEEGRVVPDGPGNGNGPAQAGLYGRARFVDLRDGRVATIVSRADCVRATAAFLPGPVG